jgi:plasmid maintenance system antidote protein VapI
MAIHIGKKIKEEMYKQNISVSDFAKKINRSRNVVYDIFGRESIDTDLLNKIGKILNCDFFSMYSSQKEYSLDTVKHFNVNESAVSYGKNSEQINALQLQNQTLQNEVNYLKKIISLLENKKEIKTKKSKD